MSNIFSRSASARFSFSSCLNRRQSLITPFTPVYKRDTCILYDMDHNIISKCTEGFKKYGVRNLYYQSSLNLKSTKNKYMYILIHEAKFNMFQAQDMFRM